jgi:uncharacterized protein YjbJ (UPF0337 family)
MAGLAVGRDAARVGVAPALLDLAGERGNRDQIEGGLRHLKGRGQTAYGAVAGRARPQAEGCEGPARTSAAVGPARSRPSRGSELALHRVGGILDPMSSTTDKIKGLANEAVGNVKQGIGNMTGNEKLLLRSEEPPSRRIVPLRQDGPTPPGLDRAGGTR